MKTPLLALAVALVLALPADAAGDERIALGDVPCTDDAWFWTQDGPRRFAVDRNLMGRGLSIGGRAYQRGIAGHTGFSAVYNLSGLATSFRCLVGVDDEDHPRDRDGQDRAADLDAVVLVDRREVLRTTIRLGAAAIPLSVDLAGAQQLELRGEYGRTGFVRQRIDFVDAEFSVGDPARFLAAAADRQARARAERSMAVEYPDAPGWKLHGIRKEAYRGLANAYRITTPHLELVVAPECGGMICSLSAPGGRNLLSENFDPARAELARGRAADGGGHFNRHQPGRLFVPPEPLLLYGRYTIGFPAEGRIVMRSPESSYLFLRQGYEIAIADDGGSLRIRNIQTNTAPFPQECGIWSITRIDTGATTALRIPAGIPEPPLPPFFEPREHAGMVRSDQGWDEIVLAPEVRRLLEAQAIEWRSFSSRPAIEAHVGGLVFTTALPDGGSRRDRHPVHLYLSKRFIELEFHGETGLVPPGGSVELAETWSLAR